MCPSLMSSVWHWLWLHGGMHVHPQINIGSKALKNIYIYTLPHKRAQVELRTHCSHTPANALVQVESTSAMNE